MKINIYAQNDTTCTLYIDNVKRNNKIKECLEIIKYFINEDEFYFSLYRVDGLNISKNQFTEYHNTIEEFFKEHVNLEIIKKDDRRQSINGILAAMGKMLNNNETYEILPMIFDYFLNTIIYKPKQNYERFKQIFKENSMQGLHYYIEKGVFDISFAYVDSGDFMICFNKNIYEEKEIIKTIESIMNE